MYIPKHYEATDRFKLYEFIKTNGFGILFSHTGPEPMATHLPFVFGENGAEQGIILGHMAKANRQRRYADGRQELVVFYGPHLRVSNSVPGRRYRANLELRCSPCHRSLQGGGRLVGIGRERRAAHRSTRGIPARAMAAGLRHRLLGPNAQAHRCLRDRDNLVTG
jgi:hypothetical protein